MNDSKNAQMGLRGQIPGVDSEDNPEVICACNGKMCDKCLDKYGIEK